jgi:hypothetical protein
VTVLLFQPEPLCWRATDISEPMDHGHQTFPILIMPSYFRFSPIRILMVCGLMMAGVYSIIDFIMPPAAWTLLRFVCQFEVGRTTICIGCFWLLVRHDKTRNRYTIATDEPSGPLHHVAPQVRAKSHQWTLGPPVMCCTTDRMHSTLDQDHFTPIFLSVQLE